MERQLTLLLFAHLLTMIETCQTSQTLMHHRPNQCQITDLMQLVPQLQPRNHELLATGSAPLAERPSPLSPLLHVMLPVSNVLTALNAVKPKKKAAPEGGFFCYLHYLPN